MSLPVRLFSFGTIGYVDVDQSPTLAGLRTVIEHQLSEQLPREGFAFVVGGTTVAVAQEASEEYSEGDIFIMSAADADAQPTERPDVSLLTQFVDAFGFMSPAEQQEAIALLLSRHPPAGALLAARNVQRGTSSPHLIQA